jgi:hypothetical protein
LLHVHTAVREDIAELILEDIKYRNPFFFLSITLTEKISDAESAEKRRNCIKKILSVLILW